jgi:hypothetical protein
MGAVDALLGRKLGGASSDSVCAACCAASAGPSCDHRRLGGDAAAACRRRLAGGGGGGGYTECSYSSSDTYAPTGAGETWAPTAATTKAPTPAPTAATTNAPTGAGETWAPTTNAPTSSDSGTCAASCFAWTAPARRRLSGGLSDAQAWNKNVAADFYVRQLGGSSDSGDYDACTCGSCCCEAVPAVAGLNMFAAEVEVEKLVHSIAVIVLITMVLEQGLHKLTHFLHHSGLDMFIEILHKLQGELMILGFISFITLMIVQFFSSTKFVSQNLLMFELAHVWIFAVGILYAVTGLIWMLIGEYFKEVWMTFQRVPLRIAAKEGGAWESKAQSKCGGFCARDISGLVKFASTKEELLEFHLLRKYFISKWKKEMAHVMGARRAGTFTFGSYLSFAATTEFVEQLEVNLHSWIVFILTTFVGRRVVLARAFRAAPPSSACAHAASSLPPLTIRQVHHPRPSALRCRNQLAGDHSVRLSVGPARPRPLHALARKDLPRLDAPRRARTLWPRS